MPFGEGTRLSRVIEKVTHGSLGGWRRRTKHSSGLDQHGVSPSAYLSTMDQATRSVPLVARLRPTRLNQLLAVCSGGIAALLNSSATDTASFTAQRSHHVESF